MKISNIKESGSSNILMWALSNGADIRLDSQLQSVINDETFYLVTISDVNFFELFRLTQTYREKLRILAEKKAVIPPEKELAELFEGVYTPDEQQLDKPVQFYELVQNSLESFINLALQMETDNDIIKSNAMRLFIPMLTRKFDIQIPVAFVDLIGSLSDDEAGRIFTSEYPLTLDSIIDEPTNGFIVRLSMEFVRCVDLIKYNQRYESYLKATKYFPLNSCKSDKLYKFGLLSFYKFDNAVKGEVRFSLFHPDNKTANDVFKRLKRLQTPLKVEFAIQLPIQYMQILENSFGRELLTISYEASMKEIIDGNIIYDDFVTPELHPSDDPESSEDKIAESNNAIEAYRVRITESNTILLNTIPILMGVDTFEVNPSDVCALLPSAYTTKAVITVDANRKNEYTKHIDPVISGMFEEMFEMIADISYDIARAN